VRGASALAQIPTEEPLRPTPKLVGGRSVVIGGWLSEADGAEFADYASSLGIDCSALATLLLVRELAANRLEYMLASVSAPYRKEKRVSARSVRLDLKARFSKHAKDNNVSCDAAAAAVFRTELAERWLIRCLLHEGESS